MVNRIADTVHDRITQIINDRLVKFCIFTFYYEVNLAAQITAQIADNTREAVENRTDGNHADFHDAFLQFACNAAKVLRRRAEFAGRKLKVVFKRIEPAGHCTEFIGELLAHFFDRCTSLHILNEFGQGFHQAVLLFLIAAVKRLQLNLQIGRVQANLVERSLCNNRFADKVHQRIYAAGINTQDRTGLVHLVSRLCILGSRHTGLCLLHVCLSCGLHGCNRSSFFCGSSRHNRRRSRFRSFLADRCCSSNRNLAGSQLRATTVARAAHFAGISCKRYIIKECCILQLGTGARCCNIVHNLCIEIIFVQGFKIRNSLQDGAAVLERSKDLNTADAVHRVGLVEGDVYRPQLLTIRRCFLELIECMLALGTADVIGARCQAVRLVRVRDDDARVLEHDLAVTIVERVAVEQHRTVRLAHADRELIHDAAVHADEPVLRLLRELHHLEHRQAEGERLVQNDRHEHLERCRRGEARTARQRAVDDDVEAMRRLVSRLFKDIYDAHEIIRPVLRRIIDKTAHRKLDDALVREIHRIDARHSVRAVAHERVGPERDRAGEHMPAVVVRMLTDEVHAPR